MKILRRAGAVGCVVGVLAGFGCTHFEVVPPEPAAKQLYLIGSFNGSALRWTAGTPDCSVETELSHPEPEVAVTACTFVRTTGERLEFRRETAGPGSVSNAALAPGVWPFLAPSLDTDGEVHLHFEGPPGDWEVNGVASGSSTEVFWNADAEELRIRFEGSDADGCDWELDYRLFPGGLCGRSVLTRSIGVEFEQGSLRLAPPAESENMVWLWTIDSEEVMTEGNAEVFWPWEGTSDLDVRIEPAPGATEFGDFRIDVHIPEEAGVGCQAPQIELDVQLQVSGGEGVAVRYRDGAGRWFRSEGSCIGSSGASPDNLFEVVTSGDFLVSDQGHATRRLTFVAEVLLFPEDGSGEPLILLIEDGAAAFPLH